MQHFFLKNTITTSLKYRFFSSVKSPLKSSINFDYILVAITKIKSILSKPELISSLFVTNYKSEKIYLDNSLDSIIKF